jgi:hypothetical protein
VDTKREQSAESDLLKRKRVADAENDTAKKARMEDEESSMSPAPPPPPPTDSPGQEWAGRRGVDDMEVA